MRPIRFALTSALAAAFLVPGGLRAQGSFEGVVTYTVTAEGMSASVRYMSKGSKLRQEIEVPGMTGAMFMLMDTEGGPIRAVMPAMGMYMEMDQEQAMAMLPEEARRQMDATPKISKLGTSETIAGVRCDNYRFAAEGQPEIEGCIATGMGWYFGGAGQMPGRGRGGPSLPDLSAYRAEFKDGMMPLRIRHQQNGQWQTIMEATAVEKKSLDDKLFELPQGLRKMTMPGG